MTLTEFLTARLAEDEATAKAAAKVEPEDTETSRWFGHAHWVAKYGTVVDASNDDYGMITDSIDEVCVHIARWDPARVLRDVEAKRRILARFQAQSRLDLPEGVHDGRDPDEAETDESMWYLLEDIVCALASVDSDHPDYDPAWGGGA